MDVTKPDVAGIPLANVRALREEFVAVWRAASDRSRERAAKGVTDWYTGAVAVTCRWMATAPTRLTSGRSGLTWSPATRRQGLAYEELIEAECLAVELLDEQRPEFVASRPGWSDVGCASSWSPSHESARRRPGCAPPS